MVENSPYFYRREPEIRNVPKEQITSQDIIGLFGIDYKRTVTDKLNELGILPEGHNLTFFDTPIPHEGSKAIYLLEEAVGNDLVLLSFLKPNSETSSHEHKAPMGKEKYYSIAGQSFLRLGENVVELNDIQNFMEVPTDMLHQLKTKDFPAFTLIIMENAAFVPKDKLHVRQKFDVT